MGYEYHDWLWAMHCSGADGIELGQHGMLHFRGTLHISPA